MKQPIKNKAAVAMGKLRRYSVSDEQWSEHCKRAVAIREAKRKKKLSTSTA